MESDGYLTPFSHFMSCTSDYGKNLMAFMEELTNDAQVSATLSSAKRCLAIGTGAGQFVMCFFSKIKFAATVAIIQC